MRIGKKKRLAIIDSYKKGIDLNSLSIMTGFTAQTINGILNSSSDVQILRMYQSITSRTDNGLA